ncbi:MAG: HAMP domain-containing protein [Brevinematales bacterium]|nr:HAMP domain-containing protein [Brevinematales bacterium]
MAKRKSFWIQNILQLLPFTQKKKKKNPIRKVFFGIRARWLFLLGLLLFVTIGIFTLLVYLSQSSVIAQEKQQKARALTESLSTSLQWYLDTEKQGNPTDQAIKQSFISNEIVRFMEINPDVIAVYVYNREAKVAFSHQRIRERKPPYTPLLARMTGTNETTSKDYVAVSTNKTDKTVSTKRYRLLSSPVRAQFGELMTVNRDFDAILVPYHKQGLSDDQRKKTYKDLYKRYEEWLPVYLHPSNFTTTEDLLAWSLDNLFLESYKAIFTKKGYSLDKDDRWLLRDAWLPGAIRDLRDALERRNVGAIKSADEKIFQRLLKLRDYGERFRFLGNVVVVYDLDQIQSSIRQNVSIAFLLAIVIYLFSMMAVYWLSGIMVRQIKMLEKWALDVSNGNLSVSVDIKGGHEIGRLADIFQMMLNELISKYHLEKFVSRSTRSMIEQKSEDKLDLGTHDRKHLAFLFSDVRGFTAFSEENDPELVITILNAYFDRQAKIIRRYRGDIDDFVGDQIMAHFGGEKRADTALQVAMEIMQDIELFNEERKKHKLPVFEIGIGVHIGDVVVGNIGSQFRMDFACIGDAVNTTSRLCSHAKSGEILASADILSEAKQSYLTEELPPLVLKGKKDPFRVMRLVWRKVP